MTISINFPPSEFEGVAIAIGGSVQQKHVGLLYKMSDGQSRFLHLAFHHDLLNDEVPLNFASLDCTGLEPDEKTDFALWVHSVWTANGAKIPYGINFWKGAHFDSSGKFHTTEDGIGLTCATFVMSLFDNFGYKLIDISSWKARSDDQEFFNKIVGHLRHPKAGASPEHIEAQVRDMGTAVRIRPEEIAASAHLYDESPIDYPTALAAAGTLVDLLIQNGVIA